MTQPPAPAPIPREVLDFPVLFDPAPAVARWRRFRGSTRWGAGSLVLNAAVWGALWWFTREDPWPQFAWLVSISMAISVLLLAWPAARLVGARRDLDRLHEGLALGIGRGGLFTGQQVLRWPEVAGIEALPPRLGGSRRLVVRPAHGAPVTLPLDYLGQGPAAIDGAVRALSGGRVGIDLSRLDD